MTERSVKDNTIAFALSSFFQEIFQEMSYCAHFKLNVNSCFAATSFGKHVTYLPLSGIYYLLYT